MQNSAPNAVTYVGSVGVWYLNVATGFNGNGTLDLNSIDAAVTGPAHLTLTLSDDYSQTANGYNFAAGGTIGSGSATFAAEENNTPFAILGPYNTVAFSGSTADNLTFTGPYNLEIVANIDHPTAGVTSFNASLSTVPLPGAILLLGAGLARLAAYARRREDT